MGAIKLARNDSNLIVMKTILFQKLEEFHFAEAEPEVGIQFACLLKSVGEEIENNDSATWPKNPMCRADCPDRTICVMERLAENCQVDALGFDRGSLQVAQAILQIGKSVFASRLGAYLNHFLRDIDRDHLSYTQGQQLGKSSFTRPEISDIDFLDEREQQV